jgi:uncharacterized protein (TIGR02266 family)
MRTERRAYPRAGIKWPVLVKTNKGSTKGVTLNVTPNGVFIRCQKPLRLNEVVEIAIHIPNSKRIMAVKTEVVWSNIYGPDDEITPRGMGVRFINIGSEDRKFIAQASLKHLKAAKFDLGGGSDLATSRLKEINASLDAGYLSHPAVTAPIPAICPVSK